MATNNFNFTINMPIVTCHQCGESVVMDKTQLKVIERKGNNVYIGFICDECHEGEDYVHQFKEAIKRFKERVSLGYS